MNTIARERRCATKITAHAYRHAHGLPEVQTTLRHAEAVAWIGAAAVYGAFRIRTIVPSFVVLDVPLTET